MITKESTLSVSQLRQKVASVLKELSHAKGPFYIFSRSEPKAVLVGIEEFNLLQEIYEDYLDAKDILSVTKKEIATAVPWKEIKRQQGLK